jgi:hypothetical protein
MKKRFLGLLAAMMVVPAAGVFSAGDAGATTLSIDMTTYAPFALYISTDDSVTGTPVDSGNGWPSTYSSSVDLTPGETNYIFVLAWDVHDSSSLIGHFLLSDTDYTFSNGTQTLVTDTSNWGVNTSGFGDTYSTPLDYGTNGASPLGYISGIDASAHFIWDPSGCLCTAYFSTAITPSQVPEPSTLLLLGSGMAGLAWLRKRLA